MAFSSISNKSKSCMKKLLFALALMFAAFFAGAQTIAINKYAQVKKVGPIYVLQVDTAGTGNWVSLAMTSTMDNLSLAMSNKVDITNSYGNPNWLTSLAWTKLIGVPTSFTPSPHTHHLSELLTGWSHRGTGTGLGQWRLGAWNACGRRRCSAFLQLYPLGSVGRRYDPPGE
jgi:hypothetical protein